MGKEPLDVPKYSADWNNIIQRPLRIVYWKTILLKYFQRGKPPTRAEEVNKLNGSTKIPKCFLDIGPRTLPSAIQISFYNVVTKLYRRKSNKSENVGSTFPSFFLLASSCTLHERIKPTEEKWKKNNWLRAVYHGVPSLVCRKYWEFSILKF